MSMEGHDEEGGVVVESIVAGDGEEEITLNVFILGAPDFFATFVDNGVLVRVVGNSSGAGQGGEEMGEELGFRGDREREVGENMSGQGGRGNDGDRGFNNRRWEVLDGDVGEGNSLDNFFKLKVDVCILMLGGWRVLKLGAYDVSLFGGDVGEDVEEVGQVDSNRGQGLGTVGVEVGGKMITSWAEVVPGVVGTIEVVLDDLVGGGDIDLISVVDLGPVSNRESGGDDEGG
jgi:hypothetical protein